jgi:hypothetical protein
MLFALPGYHFPYIVMNRCFYLMLGFRLNSRRSPEKDSHGCSIMDISKSRSRGLTPTIAAGKALNIVREEPC